MKNDLKQLTRGSLEAVSKMNARQLGCIRLKEDYLRARIRELINDIREKGMRLEIENAETGHIRHNPDGVEKAEITGRLKAICQFIDGNEQAQFGNGEIEAPKLLTYEVRNVAIAFMILGVAIGLVVGKL